ncbi:MAG: hypothetical protein ABI611_02455 [Solirubrobacteraceae bacterium]
MSATTRLRIPAPARPLSGVPVAAPPPRPWKVLVLVCLGLAALSLLGPSEPTYDPWAWIIWGRQITHLELSTTSGPSWKPLPIFFTTPFALFGDDAAPNLWLVISRAGGLLAIALAYRLGSRLGGRPAGAIAGLSLLLADEFVRNFARGNSEGLLVALCLWAIERHLDGRRVDAFLLGLGAALLRPEVWPFFGLYGLWLAWIEPRRRALVLGVFALNAFLWFAPEYWGSGDWLRAADRAHHPNADSPAFAERPFLEVFRRSAPILSVPVLVGAVIALVAAVRDRRWDVRLALGAAAVVLMVTVGLMTEGGFAGNLRYVALPAALVCVLAGLGWVGLVRAVRGRLGRVPGIALAGVLIAAAAPFVVSDLGSMREGARGLRSEANLYGNLPAVIAKAGGAARIKRCGPVFTGNFQVQVVAWELKMHSGDVGIEPKPPGIVVAARYHPFSRDPRFTLAAETSRWVVRRACGA